MSSWVIRIMLSMREGKSQQQDNCARATAQELSLFIPTNQVPPDKQATPCTALPIQFSIWQTSLNSLTNGLMGWRWALHGEVCQTGSSECPPCAHIPLLITHSLKSHSSGSGRGWGRGLCGLPVVKNFSQIRLKNCRCILRIKALIYLDQPDPAFTPFRGV